MRFAPVKEESKQEILAMHRVREMLIRQRTQAINGIRGHLAEFGVVGPRRAHRVKLLVDVIGDEEDTRLPMAARQALPYLVEQLEQVAEKLASIDKGHVSLAAQDEACKRIMTIPGVGVVKATAIVASARAADDYKSGRHLAAWRSLVPRQHSTACVDRLGGISKRGNGYLRRLLIHGSRSIMRWRRKSWTWLARLRGRRPANVATVPVANKTARGIWAMLKYGGVYGTPMRNAVSAPPDLQFPAS